MTTPDDDSTQHSPPPSPGRGRRDDRQELDHQAELLDAFITVADTLVEDRKSVV